MVFSTGLFVGIFIGTAFGAALVWQAVFLGQRVARSDLPMDKVLDPGEEVGQLPAAEPEPPVWTAPEDVTTPVGQSSGPRHARTEWPTVESVDEPTEQMTAVTR